MTKINRPLPQAVLMKSSRKKRAFLRLTPWP